MADTCCEITWMVGLLKELHVPAVTPVTLFCDNKSALYIASNERTKHIEIDCHLVHHKLLECLISSDHLPTLEQPTDVFTKALSSTHLSYLLSKLGVCNFFLPPNLKGDVSYIIDTCKEVTAKECQPYDSEHIDSSDSRISVNKKRKGVEEANDDQAANGDGGHDVEGMEILAEALGM